MSARDGDAVVSMRFEKKPSHKILMTKLLASGRHSDFTIVCCDRRFPVHRSIMCERSEMVAAAMSQPFKEADEKEIKLNQFEPEAVHGALYYAYTLCYPTDLKNSIDRELKSHPGVTAEYWTQVGKLYWTYDLELFKVADYLGLGALSKEAREKLNDRCANPSDDLFLSRTSGYVLLVRQLYYEPVVEEEGYDNADLYIELLKDTRKILLASTSKLVAKNIKNEELNWLTESIADFRQDVFSGLVEQCPCALVKLDRQGVLPDW